MPHIHEKIDFTVEVFIVYKNKVLLRKHDKYKMWLSVGGHVELDEDPNQAALREVKEEVGLDVEIYHNERFQEFQEGKYKELIPPEFMNRHNINDSHEHITLVYFAKANTDNLILSETEKSDDCKWFTKEELEDPQYNIKESIKVYARGALEKLKEENPDKSKLGLVQVFWGDGKGKTTSSFGTALRACGNGYRVHIVQFMKNGAGSLEEQIPGEIKALEKFPTFTYKRYGMDGWVLKKPTENQIKSTLEALEHVKESLKNDEIDLLIADEILYAVQLGLLSEEEILDLIDKKPEKKELILTGSHKPLPRIFEKADLGTEVKKIKHPYDKGIMARKGIEF